MKKTLIAVATLVCAQVGGARAQTPPTAPSIDNGTIVVYAVNSEANGKVTWRPSTYFTLRCPVKGGSNLIVEYKQGKKVLATGSGTLDACPAGNAFTYTSAQGWIVPDTVNLDVAGDIELSIRLTNELDGSDQKLYSGKFKVGKFKVGKLNEFYIDYDSRLPIGYTEIDYSDQQAPGLRFYLWFRKADLKGCSAHVTQAGTEIEVIDGYQWAAYGTRAPSAYQWSILQFSSGKMTPYTRTKNPGKWTWEEHPGEYEIRVVCGDQVARYVKFTTAGREIVDAAAKANSFGPNNQLLAVAVLGDVDGKYDKNAWKTGVFGNPLKDFAPPTPSAGPAVSAGPMPTLLKTTMRVEALNDNADKPTFRPQIYFTLQGPMAGGNRIAVDWLLPGGKKVWFTQTMDAPTLDAGATFDFQGTGMQGMPRFEDFPRDKSQGKPGEYGFRIRVTNTLAKSDTTLMSGKFKVDFAKDTKAYFVDQDAWLPIGLVYWSDNPQQKDSPELMVRLWMHSRYDDESCQVHVFFEGKELEGSSNANGIQSGHDKPPNEWNVSYIGFSGLHAFGTKGMKAHMAKDHPGAYEVKLLCNGKLTRTLGFTTGDGGKILDPDGLDGKNALGGFGVVVPVELKGDVESKIDKSRFKTGIYGNPVAGLKTP